MIIDGILNQVKDIILKFSTFLTKPLLKIYNQNSIPPKKKSHANFTTILETSPFSSLYHFIKDFLMKEIIKLDYGNITSKCDNTAPNSSDTIENHNEKDYFENLIHPMFSLYKNSNNKHNFNSFQVMNGLLAYLKIIKQYLTFHPFLVIQQLPKKIRIETTVTHHHLSKNNESALMLNFSFLDFLLLFYHSLITIIETTTKKINKKRKEKKVKEWKENELEIKINSNSILSSSLSSPPFYLMIYNKRKLALLHQIEHIVKTILIKIKFNKVTIINYPEKASPTPTKDQQEINSSIINNKPKKTTNTNNKNISNGNDDDDGTDNTYSTTKNNNHNKLKNNDLAMNVSQHHKDKQEYDQEEHLKLKLKLLWVDLKNEN
ncbi:hypothetical protein BCR36DRAFT_407796 [Piromyces finnis]|uniref:Uncharacterized protein n=1 Tax=Piromyces finnis TaxID=1754191 RepID=A0A1Y1VMY2_9FUNG|nr:hypothetical protein BCR36DRAFT_407796 [Piromyces finnis]|eukprot:ORX60794.1 hypothetical protein BCR36DRAFT_407796 [Piromyces finnis]